ncbi:MAG: HU family DNA-binding protein [Alphaproteobacteria bacterium CG_4_10_14_0_2_um_filter_63_37]|nr:MAG: DNA-binding protein [Proteobacteria bacterium CG1_02_64_396]PJA24603.1 MAG: HU family DNA-binding protein [Alphaproteobacteria bacterium CG_4_10_14_0_2_um_filter_63_37]
MKRFVIAAVLALGWAQGAGAVGEQELAGMIAKQTGAEQAQVVAILGALKGQIVQSLKAGQEVRLNEFGRFYLKHVPAHEARNPKTGATVQVPDRDYLRFKAFDSGQEAVNAD